MQILQANATYGKLNQASLSLQPGLNVICAPNEGGKSTWSRFLLTMFYGLNTRQRGDLADKNRFQPWSGALMQGQLELSVGEDLLTVSRWTRRADAPMGVFSCTHTGTDTTVSGVDAVHCGEMLLGVPQSVYQRCAFIPSGSITIDADADLERRINSLISSGEEKVSFSQAESRLKKQLRQRRYNRTGTIPQLESEIAELSADQTEAMALAQQESDLRQQLSQAQEEESAQRLAQQEDMQQKVEGKQRQLQKLPDSTALQEINEQLGVVRAATEETEQLRSAVQQQEEQVQSRQQELSRNPLHPMTRDELEAQLQIEPPAPPQVAQLLISLALTLCGGGFLWYSAEQAQTLWLCGACVVTALAAGNFLRLLVSRVRLQQSRRRERQRKEKLRKLAESYLPALDELEKQRDLLQQNQQAAADSEGRLRMALVQLLTQVRRWEAGVQSVSDIRRFVQQAAQDRDRLSEEIRQIQEQLLQTQPADADDSSARLRQQLTQVQGRMAAVGRPDDLERQIRQKQAQREQLQGEYDALTLALDALHSANTTLQNRFSPELGRRAAEIFFQMTGSGWSSIQLDREFHLSAGQGDDPARRSVQLLSAGTADQLYLATRLAVCEMVLPPEQNAPLILDDALITFDDERLRKTLDYLARLGERRQILLFTCQNREAAYLSGRPDVHIISLE